MKRIILVLMLAIFGLQLSYAQQRTSVHFHIVGKTYNADALVSVSGKIFKAKISTSTTPPSADWENIVNVLDLSTHSVTELSDVTGAGSGAIITIGERAEIVANTLKVTNVTTNLSEGTSTTTTVDVDSSDGTNVTLQPASTIRAGVMSKAKFDEVEVNNAKVTNSNQILANTSTATTHTVTLSDSGGSIQLAEGSGISLATTGTGLDGVVTITNTQAGTNLSYIASPTEGAVTSSTGTDATLPLGTGTNAGLLSPSDFTVLGNTSNTNTGDQTSIVGITGTKTEFNAALTDGNFVYESAIATTPKDISFGESYIQNYRNRTLDDGATYFPNIGAFHYAEMKSLGIQNDMSLMFTPSGVKATKLYSQKPLNGIGDFTVVRGSTATYTDEEGIIQIAAIDVARINYTDGEEELLLEPQSTNLYLRSEEFDNAAWEKGNSSIIPNDVISPDGTFNADKLVENSANSPHKISQLQLQPNPQNLHSQYIYVKHINRQFVQLTNEWSSNYAFAVFDILNGTITQQVTNGTGVISNVDIFKKPNGWYKLILTSSIGSSGFNATSFKMVDTGTPGAIDPIYQGDGVSGIYIWGAQLEELPYATSYIKTVASTVTRLADQVTDAGDSTTFNSEEGVLFVEMAALFNDLTSRRITISDGTGNNRLNISYSQTSNQIQAFMFVGGALQANLVKTISNPTDFIKVAFKWKVNDFAFWVNGVEEATDLNGIVFPQSTLDDIRFADAGGAEIFFGKIKSVKVFKTALTDAELEALTKNLIPFILIGFKRRRKTEYKLAA